VPQRTDGTDSSELAIDGVSDFNALHSGKHNREVQLYAFDILAIDSDGVSVGRSAQRQAPRPQPEQISKAFRSRPAAAPSTAASLWQWWSREIQMAFAIQRSLHR
jgi:hypothetical protein